MLRMIISGILIILGLCVFIIAAIGVNKFDHALNRMHAAALGDTLGILFVMAGLVVWRGISFVSLKLIVVIIFFWFASPVAGHMISRLEAQTDEELGEIEVEKK